MAHTAVRVAAGVALVLTASALAGCAPSIDSLVRDNLAGGVEEVQDTLWEYRDQIARDPEAAVAGLDFLGDARAGVVEGARPYTLVDLESAADGATLTLVVRGGATTGGGLWAEQALALTCVDFVFPRAVDEIRVEEAACTDVPDIRSDEEIVPFRDLPVRESVTAEDYPPPICQCHSGGDCDCPGG